MLVHVRRERHVDAPREEVWEAVLDDWVDGAEVEEAEPPRRLSWRSGDDTLVEVTLDDEGEGTRVVVVEAPLERVRAIGTEVQRALPAGGPLLLA